MCRRTSSGTRNAGSSGQPYRSFVSRTSSFPRASPCAFDVSCLLGLPHPMCVRQATKVGRDASRRAAAAAASISSSVAVSASRSTFQPYASKRRQTSSVNVIGVPPSIVMRLSSQNTHRRERPRWPASEAASDATPSIRSPSLAITQVRWSTTSSPGRLNRAASMRSASAMPTAFAKPCPRGPVVVSTPGVRWLSGWPGVRLPHWRNAFKSSSERS